jgi:hypothetical protein
MWMSAASEPTGEDTSAPQPFPGPTLMRLLDLAGPEGRGPLLAQIRRDLCDQADLLAQATDLASIRQATHVLIALTGSLGADVAMAEARALHALAVAGDQRALPEALCRAVTDLLGLLPLADLPQPR